MGTHSYLPFLYFIFVVICCCNGYEVTIVIRNMHLKESQTKAEQMRVQILDETKDVKDFKVNVLALHEDWAPVNGWTIFPIFEHLYERYKKSDWLYFCEDTTEIDAKKLITVLKKYDQNEEMFLGHGLHDTEASIIHHFAHYQNPGSFLFPDFDAGWAISMKLLKRAVEKLKKEVPSMNFSIDVKHEIAMFFKKEDTKLTDVAEFCVNKPLKGTDCASTINYAVPNCGEVDNDDILVAVKTCEKYHKDRVPIVKETVGQHVKHIRYYSDKVDESIPTEFIGVKNTNSGHCQKLRNIIGKFNDEEFESKKWLVVIDDDTIMNYKRLQKMLACYDYDKPILLGERYAYGINYKNWGYSYPTGGGGMVMSHAAVKKLIDYKSCKCHSEDSPDDMWLGMCFREMNIPMVHTNSFHQTQPSQYTKEFLSHRYLVSFHKHHPTDPLQIYRDYLSDDVPKTEL